MSFEINQLYHIYNRGNNKQKIFYSERNYEFFLQKVRIYLIPHCNIVAYCLMPNHFHFLIQANENSMQEVSAKQIIAKNALSNGLKMLLSSYAKAINKQENKTGNLFQQNTKYKPLCSAEIQPGVLLQSSLYEEDCFNYIHYNPVHAGLIAEPGAWKYSSYNEYLTGGGFQLCDTSLGMEFFKRFVVPN